MIIGVYMPTDITRGGDLGIPQPEFDLPPRLEIFNKFDAYLRFKHFVWFSGCVFKGNRYTSTFKFHIFGVVFSTRVIVTERPYDRGVYNKPALIQKLLLK
jgi:hypothetical protein